MKNAIALTIALTCLASGPGWAQQRAVVPDPDGWFHARIRVTSSEVRVFVNDAPEPGLVVVRLARGGGKRPLGLFVDSAEGVYANLTIAPDNP